MLCESISNFLKVDKRTEMKNIYSHFVGNVYQDYVHYQEEIEKCRIVLLKKNQPQDFFELIDSCESRTYEYFFSKVLKFFLVHREYKRSVDFLKKFKKKSMDELNFVKLIDTKYRLEGSVSSIAHASLSALLIGIGNDEKLCKNEINLVRNSMKEFYEIFPTFPIENFSMGEFLRNNPLDKDDKDKLIKVIQSAILSDGEIDDKERFKFSKIVSSLRSASLSNIPIDYFSVVAVYFLLLDNRLTDKEKSWYRENCLSVFHTHSINSLFLLFNVLCLKDSIAKENVEFFREVFRASQEDIDTAAIYSFIYLQKFKKVGEARKIIDVLSCFISSTSYQKLKVSSKNRVISEEVMLFLNIFCDRTKNRTNEILQIPLEYVKELFGSVDNDLSDLSYFTMTQILLNDDKISKTEYGLLWEQFEKMNIDPKKLSRAIYDYSLLCLSDIDYIQYENYLKTA